MRQDGGLLPSRIYIADYSENPEGARVPDFRGHDLRDVSLSIVTSPWIATGAELDELIPRLFEYALPYTEPRDHPKDWYCFRTAVDDGVVSGFLFLVGPNTRGSIELFLKRMHVETAGDITQTPAYSVFGLIDITPGDVLDAKVPSARDHIVRNKAYLKICTTVEDTCIDFYEKQAKQPLTTLVTIAQGSTSSADVFREFHNCLNDSIIYRIRCSLDKVYVSLFRDTPALLNKLVTAAGCPEIVKVAVLTFAKANKWPPDASVTPENLSSILQVMQATADATHEQERAAQASNRKAPAWNPRASKRFVEKIGPYLPFVVHRREQRASGQFSFHSGRVPLAAIKLLDLQAASVLKVLMKGSPADYLVRNRNVPLVVEARSDEDLIALCLVCKLCFPDLELDFVIFERDLFKEMATRDEWEPLVALLRQIVSRAHEEHTKEHFKVDARGYDPDYLPLLAHSEDGQPLLVINGYNNLMKDLKDTYRLALEQSDREVAELIGLVLHELYHYVSPAAIAERPPEERHIVTTRTEMLRSVLSMVEKYTDLKLRR